MQEDNSSNIKNAIEESVRVKQLVLTQELYRVLIEIGDSIVESILSGGKVLICGNGGSAADAQHLTAGHALIEYVEARLIKEGFLSLK